MNIFVLDLNLEKCAQYHNDKHVVKMLVEYAQLLSTAVRMSGMDYGYKITHVNHPCAKWVRDRLSNWMWLRELSFYLNKEYKFRYSKPTDHKSFSVINSLPIPNLRKSTVISDFALVMPDEYKGDDPVDSYRRYYVNEKRGIGSWKNRGEPEWWKEDEYVL